MKSKITARTEAKKYENEKGVNYYRNYTLENGTIVYLGSPDEDPSWGQLGQELEYAENGKYPNGNIKYKRVTGFGGGGVSVEKVRGEVAKGAAVLMFAMGNIKEDQIKAASERFYKLMSI